MDYKRKLTKKSPKKDYFPFFFGIIIALLFALNYQAKKINENLLTEIELLENRKIQIQLEMIELQQQYEEPEAPAEVILYQGDVSWYGESDDECLDCSENRVMANGQVFDETKYTLAIGLIWDDETAIPLIPLNTTVLVRNLDNNKTIEATVTDTGGFYSDEYGNRIADLSKGLAHALDIRTNHSEVQILESDGLHD